MVERVTRESAAGLGPGAHPADTRELQGDIQALSKQADKSQARQAGEGPRASRNLLLAGPLPTSSLLPRPAPPRPAPQRPPCPAQTHQRLPVAQARRMRRTYTPQVASRPATSTQANDRLMTGTVRSDVKKSWS